MRLTSGEGRLGTDEVLATTDRGRHHVQEKKTDLGIRVKLLLISLVFATNFLELISRGISIQSTRVRTSIRGSKRLGGKREYKIVTQVHISCLFLPCHCERLEKLGVRHTTARQ